MPVEKDPWQEMINQQSAAHGYQHHLHPDMSFMFVFAFVVWILLATLVTIAIERYIHPVYHDTLD